MEPKPAGWDQTTRGKWLGRKPGPYKWYEIQDSIDYFAEFEKPKIILGRFMIKPLFVADESSLFVNDALYIYPKADYYLLSLLNSRLLWFQLTNICTALQNGYIQAYLENLSPLSIRRISFTTSPAVRQKQLAQAKSLHADFLKSSYRSATLEFVADLLEKDQSDVVHDFLAFLAEKMIAMNKTKQEEIAGFLKYAERLIGADIDALANKTLIKDYHRHAFGQVLAVLERNKNKLKSFNPKSRAAQEALEKEFNQSVAKLTPLKAKIQATDDLIDQIVYKLYGLTSAEIEIVENSVKK